MILVEDIHPMLVLPLLDDNVWDLRIVRPGVLNSLSPYIGVVLHRLVHLQDRSYVLLRVDDCGSCLRDVIEMRGHPSKRVVFENAFCQEKRGEVFSPSPPIAYDVARSVTLPEAASLRLSSAYSARIMRLVESPVTASSLDWNGRR